MKTRLFFYSFIVFICGLHISIAQQSKDIDKTSNTPNPRIITNVRTVEELSSDPVNVKRIDLTRKELTDNGINMALGGTHSGNPVCCAAALANLEYLSNNNFQKKLKDKVYIFEQRCKELLKYKIVKNVNFKGNI